MEIQELIQKIQKVEIACEKLTQQKLAGLFNSSFHGRGWSIDSVRKYEVGDNIRDIEWNVTARFRETFVKTFTQEKERQVWILLDVSNSMRHNSLAKSKHDVAREIGAALAFSALDSQDQVGVILYSDKIERLIPMARGKAHFWRIAKELVAVSPASKATDSTCALEFLLKSNTKSSVVFLVSDFVGGGYERASQVVAQQHELVAIRVFNEQEAEVPRLGWMRMLDAESGKTRWMNTSSAAFRQRQQSHFDETADRFRAAYHNTAVRHLSVSTPGNYMESLIHFLQRKA
ncbi:DUF58 domain-containing protein [Hymenobacter rubidus]|uniref:DUF58 domain-containing protein n=1 Tax=Hymenobacter rubidus TaxID=1441626 RepID=UPI00191E5BEA|nr:DUF58 domain-containing protein [Hymenobacter rubidus]